MPKGKNFSEDERRRLRELVLSKSDIIECKKSDCVSLKKKKETWDKIHEEFNSTAETSRTHEQLKRLWDNIKTKRKAELAADRREVLRTGGGSPVIFSPPDPELDSLGIDSEIKDAIDSDCIATLNEKNGYYIVEDNNIYLQTNNQNENISPANKENKQDVVILSPANKENYKSTTPKICPKDNFLKSKRKPEAEFSAEATARVARSQYLLELDRTIGALRTQEAEVNLEIAKEKLEYIQAKKAKLFHKE